MSQYEAAIRGLTVNKNGSGWRVTHAGSGLEVVSGLRQRRFAEQARTDLLATGTDFTQDSRAISAQRKQWADVYWLWQQRAHQVSYDDTTFEYYPHSVRYGTFVPSAGWAEAMRAAMSQS
jgi:hypothetical protein